MLYDVIIIGKGPAGLSASIYTARGNLKTLIIGKESMLRLGSVIENFCCAPQVSGEELIRTGIEQAKKFGVEMVEEEVLSINKEKYFKIVTDLAEYQAEAIILATGKLRDKIAIENLNKFEGQGVHYCVTCDGFFYKNKKVGILGYKDYAVHELSEITSYTKDVTLYTNGHELKVNYKSRQFLKENPIDVKKRPITSLEGDNNGLNKIVFEHGEEKDIDGLFIAYSSASSIDFALKLGIAMKDDFIMVDNRQKTNIEGLFAAGDCTGGLAQVATAVGQGAVAGQNAKDYIKSINKTI
ncbi:MAG TPA: NAD(P)/FAD-dependent oxidoreductase [Thermoanaerobacterales bacterium]|jgi:thioredoxin reductase (NADPH)|nr:NAD(P)/FAD-dependent oxidoreductase [Thermoanaerobacterales bacterium]